MHHNENEKNFQEPISRVKFPVESQSELRIGIQIKGSQEITIILIKTHYSLYKTHYSLLRRITRDVKRKMVFRVQSRLTGLQGQVSQ